MEKEVNIMTDFSTNNMSYIDSVPGWVDNPIYLRASLHLSMQSINFWNQLCWPVSTEKEIVKGVNFPQRIPRIYSLAAWLKILSVSMSQLINVEWQRDVKKRCRVTKSRSFSPERSGWLSAHGSCLPSIKQSTWFSKRISDWQLSRGLAYISVS